MRETDRRVNEGLVESGLLDRVGNIRFDQRLALKFVSIGDLA